MRKRRGYCLGLRSLKRRVDWLQFESLCGVDGGVGGSRRVTLTASVSDLGGLLARDAFEVVRGRVNAKSIVSRSFLGK